jgi:hypothetical protein
MNNYELLIRKLDAFIRKFYANHLLRGTLIIVGAVLGIVLLLSLGEYFLYFPAWLKMTLLSIFSLAGLAALGVWILIPLMHMQRLGKTISHEQAAVIIGRHFPDVKDKLLNVLQLKHSLDPAQSWELAAASIKQKSDEIALVPFLKAVNIADNKKFLPYVLPVVLIFAGILLWSPNIFKDAAGRLLQPGTNFSPPAPFSFFIDNKSLQVPINGSYELHVITRGAKIPDQVNLVIAGQSLNMQKTGPGRFSYTFHKVSRDISFFMAAAGLHSPGYVLNVVERPILQGFVTHLAYPAYTQMKDQELQSLIDISVPYGTRVYWKVKTRFADQVSLKYQGAASEILFKKSSPEAGWSGSMIVKGDSVYKIYLSNKALPHADSFQYRVHSIPDEAPRVMAQQIKDSISGRQVLLSGQAADDYGIRRLYFHYYITNEAGKTIADKRIFIQKAQVKLQSFQYYFDIATMDLEPGDDLHYYVEAWDNDAINGSKRGVSDVFNYRQSTRHQMDSLMRENAEQMKQNLSSSASQARSMNKQAEQLQHQLLDNKSMDWDQQQALRSLVQKQEQIKDQLEALKKRFEEQREHSRQQQHTEAISEKQAAIEKQMDQLLNKELASQLKKLQELLAQKNKENTFQKLQEWEQQNKLFNMDMERIKELMNKLDLQMKLEDMAHKLEALARDQQALKQKTALQKADNQSLANDQEQLKNELNDLMKHDFAAIEKANQQLENQQSLSGPEKLGDAAKEEMQNSKGELRRNQNSDAQQAQEKATEHLQKMAASMMQMAGGMDMEQLDINIRAVRQLLTNLIRYSFDQEDLLIKENAIPVTSSLYKQNAVQQNRLKDNARMIRDSLFSLSKRVFQLAPTINKETTELTEHINRSLALLEARHPHEARVHQQYAMSNANNLALMLNETLENMMQMQAQAGKGSGQSGKPKPGQGQAGQMMKDIITGQQKMGKGIEKAGEGQEPGRQSGKQGQQTGGGQQSEQIARLAQEQARLRRQIQELSSMLNSKGMGGQNAGLLQEIQEAMNKNETDLVNRRLGSELQLRQQQIMSRMLQAEKAIREQEEDNKRVANSGKNMPRPMPPELKDYLRNRKLFLESYQSVPADLNPFYKKMTEDYWKAIHK